MKKHWSTLCALILAFVYLTVSFAEADGSFRVSLLFASCVTISSKRHSIFNDSVTCAYNYSNDVILAVGNNNSLAFKNCWNFSDRANISGVTVVSSRTVQTRCKKRTCLAKQGRCPQKHWGTAKCVEFCYRDSDCPDDEKCCSNGCGHECVAPYKVKLGRCGFPQRTQMCAEYCYHDGQCPGTEKCCRTTCGHACTEPC